MEISIQKHTLERAVERGTNIEEIIDVIEAGLKSSAIGGRLAASKVFVLNQIRNGKHYNQKRVEVIYIEENGVIFTITVYVFYGKWED